MMRLAVFARRLRRNRRGAALVEFALTAPVFLLLLMGIFDYGWQLYARQVLQGAMSKAARDATLEANNTSQTALDAKVEAAVKNVFRNATVEFSRRTYDSFDAVGSPEPFVDKVPLNGRYDIGECFEDINGNGVWDSDRAREGNGGADDVVLYTATMSFDRVLPVWNMLGQSKTVTMRESTVLRNQPFTIGTDADPVKCG